MLVRTAKHYGKPWEKLRRVAVPVIKKAAQATSNQAGSGFTREDHRIPSEPSEADGVLQIRLDEATAWVQPNVTMGALVQSTMKVGLIPTVVASSKDMTVAEAFATKACGLSSFRYGTFDCAVLSVKGISHDGQELMIRLNDNDAVDQHFGVQARRTALIKSLC